MQKGVKTYLEALLLPKTTTTNKQTLTHSAVNDRLAGGGGGERRGGGAEIQIWSRKSTAVISLNMGSLSTKAKTLYKWTVTWCPQIH